MAVGGSDRLFAMPLTRRVQAQHPRGSEEGGAFGDGSFVTDDGGLARHFRRTELARRTAAAEAKSAALRRAVHHLRLQAAGTERSAQRKKKKKAKSFKPVTKRAVVPGNRRR